MEKDYTEAVKYYQLAADQGEPLAQSKIGHFYLQGRRVDPDYLKAFKYIKLASDGGSSSYAQFTVGLLCEYGMKGVVKNTEEAIKYYKLVAEQCNMFAAENLARMQSFSR